MGRVAITSPNSVTEGNSVNTTFVITIQLLTGSVALGRDVVYSVELNDGTATGKALIIICCSLVTFFSGNDIVLWHGFSTC